MKKLFFTLTLLTSTIVWLANGMDEESKAILLYNEVQRVLRAAPVEMSQSFWKSVQDSSYLLDFKAKQYFAQYGFVERPGRINSAVRAAIAIAEDAAASDWTSERSSVDHSKK